MRLSRIITATIIMALCLQKASAQTMDFSMYKLNGVTASYHYAGTYLTGTKTVDPFFEFYHTAYIGLVGPMDYSDGSTTTFDAFFGSIGFIIGKSARPFDYALTGNFYDPDGQRITSFEPRGFINAFGGKLHLMGFLGTPKHSITATYFFMDIEYMNHLFATTVTKGAFGQYYTKKGKAHIDNFAFSMGIKAALLEASVGLGYGTNLYTKGMTYEVPDGDDCRIRNQPEKKGHLVLLCKVGLVIDLFKLDW